MRFIENAHAGLPVLAFDDGFAGDTHDFETAEVGERRVRGEREEGGDVVVCALGCEEEGEGEVD